VGGRVHSSLQEDNRQCSNCTRVFKWFSIKHAHLKFQKGCAWWVTRELKEWEKMNLTVCPCNIPYGKKMEKICLTGLLLGTNHGCITTNLNQSTLQCNGNILVHLQPKSLRSCFAYFGILWKCR
jgi:hypothetical protein